MMQPCSRCKNQHDQQKDKTCRECYELAILKGQCLNIAGMLVKKESKDENPNLVDRKKTSKQILLWARDIFEEAKEQKFLEW